MGAGTTTEKSLSNIAASLEALVGKMSKGAVPKSPSFKAPAGPKDDWSVRDTEKYQRELLKGTSVTTKIYSKMMSSTIGRAVVGAFTHMTHYSKDFFSKMGSAVGGLFNKVFGQIMTELQPFIAMIKATASYMWNMLIKPMGKFALSMVASPFKLIFGLGKDRLAKDQLKEEKKQTKLLSKIANVAKGGFFRGKASGLGVSSFFDSLFGKSRTRIIPGRRLIHGGKDYGEMGASQTLSTGVGILGKGLGMVGGVLGAGMDLVGMIPFIGPLLKVILGTGLIMGAKSLFEKYFPDTSKWIAKFYKDNLEPYVMKMKDAVVDAIKTGFIGVYDYIKGKVVETVKENPLKTAGIVGGGLGLYTTWKLGKAAFSNWLLTRGATTAITAAAIGATEAATTGVIAAATAPTIGALSTAALTATTGSLASASAGIGTGLSTLGGAATGTAVAGLSLATIGWIVAAVAAVIGISYLGWKWWNKGPTEANAAPPPSNTAPPVLPVTTAPVVESNTKILAAQAEIAELNKGAKGQKDRDRIMQLQRSIENEKNIANRTKYTSSDAGTFSSESTWMKMIGGAEGTGKNPKSSAEGFGQFTKTTWTSYAKMAKYSDEIANDFEQRKNYDIAMNVLKTAREDYIRVLKREGFEPSDENLYAMHFFGEPVALAYLRVMKNSKEKPELTNTLISSLEGGAAAVASNSFLEGHTVNDMNWGLKEVVGHGGRISLARTATLSDRLGRKEKPTRADYLYTTPPTPTPIPVSVESIDKMIPQQFDFEHSELTYEKENTNILDRLVTWGLNATKNAVESLWNMTPDDIAKIGNPGYRSSESLNKEYLNAEEMRKGEEIRLQTILDAKRQLSLAGTNIDDITALRSWEKEIGGNKTAVSAPTINYITNNGIGGLEGERENFKWILLNGT